MDSNIDECCRPEMLWVRNMTWELSTLLVRKTYWWVFGGTLGGLCSGGEGQFYECHGEVVKEAFWVFMLSKSSREAPPPPPHDEPNDLSSKCVREGMFHCQHTIPISFL